MSGETNEPSVREQRVNEAIAAYLEAVDVGEAPDPKEFIDAHSDIAVELESFFANRDEFERMAEPLQPAGSAAPEPQHDDVTLPPASEPTEAPTLAPSETADATIGSMVRYFGDYELLDEIARGGMGVVYKARQVSLNRIVAVKMILAGQLASEEDVQRFHAEAEAAANLDHPGIVPIYEVGEHEGQHYFSMGFVQGSSLSAKVANGPLPPREAAEHTKKVAEAVAFAHSQGVIHRDLKPANVLLKESPESRDKGPEQPDTRRPASSASSRHSTHDSQPMVTDFGLAKKVEGDSGLTATGQILGTPGYMPPEQASGKIDEVTETADVYSLGAILYALLTGHPPFQADNFLDTLMQVLEREPVSPRQLNSKVPRDLETICLKCMEKDRRRRYASAQELADELIRFLNDEPIHARPISGPARACRWCRRKPLAASLIALSAIFLVSFMVLLQYTSYTRRVHAEQTLAERTANDRTRAVILVDSLTAAPAEAVPYVIQNLESLREYAVPILRMRLDESDSDRTGQLHVACALAEFGEFDFTFPFHSLKGAGSGECPNVVGALEDAPDAFLPGLDDQIEAAGANQDWPFKARLAVVALHLGDREPAEDMLEFEGRPDPIQRTVFIETLSNWHANLEQLKRHVVDAEDPGLRSGICLAVGSIEGIDAATKAQWQNLLTQWYSTQPDGGTHSAAGWALRQWNAAEPPIDDAQLRGKQRGWTVTEQTGLTMIRIPAGQFERQVRGGAEPKQQLVRITRDFLLSDREITIGLFRRFVDDEEYQGEKPKWKGEYQFPKATPSHPVQTVSWHESVMLCNWLSWKENRTACYKISGAKASGGTARIGEEYEVELIEGASGFRLPTEAEWEYACRAGTTARFSFGDDEAILARYGIYSVNSNSQTAQVGTRLCNAWGLFGMHGNVFEWCWDWDPHSTKASFRVCRGGGYGSAARYCESSVRIRIAEAHRFGFLGFRVAAVPSSKSSQEEVKQAEPRAEAEGTRGGAESTGAVTEGGAW